MASTVPQCVCSHEQADHTEGLGRCHVTQISVHARAHPSVPGLQAREYCTRRAQQRLYENRAEDWLALWLRNLTSPQG